MSVIERSTVRSPSVASSLHNPMASQAAKMPSATPAHAAGIGTGSAREDDEHGGEGQHGASVRVAAAIVQ